MSPCIFIKEKRGGGRADFAPENKRNFPFSLDFQCSSTRKLWQRDNWCLMCYLCAGFSCEVLEVVCVCVSVRFCYKCHLKILLSHMFPACFLWAAQGCAYINNEKRLLWQREVFYLLQIITSGPAEQMALPFIFKSVCPWRMQDNFIDRRHL